MFFAFVAFAFSVRVQTSLPKPTLRSLPSMSYSSILKKKNNQECTENINRHFCKEDIKMAKRHMKIFSKSNYSGNTNRNYKKVLSHTGQNDHHQEVYK